jgi:hypothetical protein
MCIQILGRNGLQGSTVIINPNIRQISPSAENERNGRKRKSKPPANLEVFIAAVDPDDLGEEAHLLKRMREAQSDESRFISFCKDNDDDFWKVIPDPDDLFPELRI